MRLALVSDIHGNLAALEAVMQDIDRRQVHQVINLGDTLSGPLLPLETAQRLRRPAVPKALSPAVRSTEGSPVSPLPWLHVAGNHERQVLQLPLPRQNLSDAYTSGQLADADKTWLASHADPCDPRLHRGALWPDRLGSDVALCHGSPRSDIEYLLETPVGEAARLATPAEIEERLDGRIPPHIGLLACGHTHVPRSVRLGRGLLIVNPGSVGLPAYDDDHPYPLSNYHRIETGSPDARYAVVEKHNGRWTCDLISVPYDHESMALLADQRSRPDWAYALRTGYVPRP